MKFSQIVYYKHNKMMLNKKKIIMMSNLQMLNFWQLWRVIAIDYF